MTMHFSQFEEFMIRFTTLKTAAKGEPSRVATFYKESHAIRDAVDNIASFLLHTNFEQRVFHGPTKHFLQVPEKFELAWIEYSRNWADTVSSTWNSLHEADPEKLLSPEGLTAFKQYQTSIEHFENSRDEFERHLTKELCTTKGIRLKPDERFIFSYRFGKIRYAIINQPEYYDRLDGMTDPNEEFDPRKHNGADLLQLLISFLRELVEGKHEFATDIHVALGAYDYLTETIGLDIADIFRRWKTVPVTFMPAHISNKYGQTEKGSLYDLINDAVRAYVFGAPAAAIAMCRAALEMVLKRHYGRGEWDDRKLKLGEIIVLASQRFNFIQEGKLTKLTQNANEILHNYSRRNRMSEQDGRTILEFLKTVKYLIQRAPN